MSQSYPGVPPGWLQDILRFTAELAAVILILAAGIGLGYLVFLMAGKPEML